MRNRVFSGIKPSGRMHLGNYIGAISQWVKHQDHYENYFCVVDLHAITTKIDPGDLKKQTRDVAAWYLAAGISPEQSVIFIQSHNPDHTQLAWILNCHTSVGQLARMTQYKDKKSKSDFASIGLFDYPVLMAADILLYQTDLVPVGEDQKQHVELTRDIAEHFNHKFGDLFKIPTYMPPPTGARIMSLQNPTNKMAKSEHDPNGTIYLDDSKDSIRKKVMAAVTDSGNQISFDSQKPAISNLASIFIALGGQSIDELDQSYSGKGYRQFKQDLAELIIHKLGPISAKYQEITNSNLLEQSLQKGCETARSISQSQLEKVYSVVGLR